VPKGYLSNEQNIHNCRILGIYKGPEKVVVGAHYWLSTTSRCSNNLYRRFCFSAIYLRIVLGKITKGFKTKTSIPQVIFLLNL